jgi:predicted TPR repeat methyltransferase
VNPVRWLNVLKQKVKAFDIKPNPPVIPELFAAIEKNYEADPALVFGNLYKILEISPQNYEALLMLSEMCLNYGKMQEGCTVALLGAKHYKNDFNFHKLLGSYFGYLGDLQASAKSFKRALELNPNSISLQYLLQAAQKKKVNIAPREYISNLFNNYADTYEVSLLQNLEYKSHIELVDYLRLLIPQEPVDSLLDLGCGTGLFGHEFTKKVEVKKLVGVDLSENMLTKSKEKNIYTELHQSDLIEYLQKVNTPFDIITLTDVLVYIGDLEPVIANSYKALKPGGYLGFTVEALDSGTYELNINGRYRHSLSYITTLNNRYRFGKIYSKTIALRKEYGNNVAGYLVLLQK